MRGLSNASILTAWRSGPFRRFFLANFLSVAGRALQMTVIGFIVFELTGSSFLLGLVSFMQMAPVLILAPLVGVLVDHFDRRRILTITFTTKALALLCLGAISIVGDLSVTAIAVTVIIIGVAGTFTFPARSALIPSLVQRDSLQSAIASTAILGTAARVSAPAAGGLALDLAGVSAALLIGVGLYFPAAIIIALVPLRLAAETTVARHPFSPQRAVRTFGGDLRDVGHYIRGNRMLRAALVNDIVPFMFGMSYIAILPAVAVVTLDGGASTLGLLHGVSGAGALLGTLAAGTLSGRGRRGRVIWVSTFGWGLAMLTVAAGSTYPSVLAGLFFVGCFQALYIVQNDTLVQVFTVDRFRGRVIAAQAMINGLTTLGFLEIGLVAEAATISLALAVHGTALVLMAFITLLFRPH
ncbi:MAG TPA: MFS transporter, partial [Thermomicrobiales bacterium]|nr:MFS transporter [Thermomicrobiales bacterium]